MMEINRKDVEIIFDIEYPYKVTYLKEKRKNRSGYIFLMKNIFQTIGDRCLKLIQKEKIHNSLSIHPKLKTHLYTVIIKEEDLAEELFINFANVNINISYSKNNDFETWGLFKTIDFKIICNTLSLCVDDDIFLKAANIKDIVKNKESCIKKLIIYNKHGSKKVIIEDKIISMGVHIDEIDELDDIFS